MGIKIQRINKEPIVQFNGKFMKLPAGLQNKINKYWDEVLASGKNLFNGEVFAIDDVSYKNGDMKISVKKTDYKHFMYNRNIDDNLGEYNIKTINSSGIVLSSDNKIILGLMGRDTFREGWYQMSGGGLDNSDLKENVFDMKGSATRELKEELNINIDNKRVVKKFDVSYLKTSGNGNISIIYTVILSEASQEILNNYKRFEENLKIKNITPEFSEIIALPLNKKNIREFVDRNKDIMAEYLPAVLQQIIKNKQRNIIGLIYI